MASYRFLTINRVENTTTILKNGTGGAPPRDEVAPYVMENAMQRDRRVVWVQASGGALAVDFDLGSATLVQVAGLFGHRPLDTAVGGVISCTVKYGSSYPPASTFGTIVAPARDAVTLPTQQTMRYWRFDLDAVAGQFALGNFWLGRIDQDLGSGPSSQTERRRVPSITDRSAGEDPIVTLLGDVRSVFALEFRNVTSAVVSKLRSIAASGQSFVLLDGFDTPFVCVVADSEIELELVFVSGGVPLYNARLTAEQLG